MPPLAIAKGRIGEALGFSSTESEGQQNMLCAYLSAALLAGLGANTLFGLWWADPVTALLIAGVAIKDGREAWRGESCCTAPVVGGEDSCDDGCCASGSAARRAKERGAVSLRSARFSLPQEPSRRLPALSLC